MTANRKDDAIVTLGDAIDVAAAVPYLLGFAPCDSIVFVFFRQRDGRLIVTGRLDLPASTELRDEFTAGVKRVLVSARDAGADALHLLVYPAVAVASGPDVPGLAGMCRELAALAGSFGMSVWSSGIVGNDLWFDPQQPNSSGEPIDSPGSDAVAEFVGRGVAFFPSRRSMNERVAGPPTSLASQVLECVVDIRRLHEVPGTARARDRRDIEDAVVEFVLTPASHPLAQAAGVSRQAPRPAVLAGWALAMKDRRVREPILRQLAVQLHGGRDARQPSLVGRAEALDRFCWLVRNTPPELAAPFASALAAFCWQVGNGPMALIAADHALTCDPDNNLAGLVEMAVGQGVSPRVWIEMLLARSQSELRAGRCLDRHRYSGPQSDEGADRGSGDKRSA